MPAGDKFINCDNNASLPLIALFDAILTINSNGCPSLRVSSSIDGNDDFVSCDNNYQTVMDRIRELLVLDANSKPAFNIVHAGPVIFPSYTVAVGPGQLPAAATYVGGNIFVTDETGGPVPAYSDGTNWRRYSDGAIVS